MAAAELVFYLQSCYRESDDIGIHIGVHTYLDRIRFNRVHLVQNVPFFALCTFSPSHVLSTRTRARTHAYAHLVEISTQKIQSIFHDIMTCLQLYIYIYVYSG